MKFIDKENYFHGPNQMPAQNAMVKDFGFTALFRPTSMVMKQGFG
jgi:hypothetical protein